MGNGGDPASTSRSHRGRAPARPAPDFAAKAKLESLLAQNRQYLANAETVMKRGPGTCTVSIHWEGVSLRMRLSLDRSVDFNQFMNAVVRNLLTTITELEEDLHAKT